MADVDERTLARLAVCEQDRGTFPRVAADVPRGFSDAEWARLWMLVDSVDAPRDRCVF